MEGHTSIILCLLQTVANLWSQEIPINLLWHLISSGTTAAKHTTKKSSHDHDDLGLEIIGKDHMIDKCLDGTLTLKSIDDNQCKYVTQKADVASIMRSIGALPDLYYNNAKS